MLIQISPPAVDPVTLAEARLACRVDSDFTAEDTLISSLITSATQDAEAILQRSLIMQSWRLVLDAFPGPSLMGVPYGVPYSIPGHAIALERGTVQSVDSITYFGTDGVWATMSPANYMAELSGCPGRITPVFGQIWPITRPQIGSVKVDYAAGYAAKIAADATADTITPDRWRTLAVNDAVSLSNLGGALPAPLVAGATYYVQSVPSAGVYKLSATVGGAAIDLTDAGSGTSLIGAVPEGIRRWMKIRIATLYNQREEVAILSRGKVEALPYVEGLLDPFKVVRY